MKDQDKTKEQLIDELVDSRKRIPELNASVTKHKQTEKTLQESEEKLKTIMENINDVIFQLSPLGIIKYVSPRVKEIYGYKPEELTGKHLKKTTPISEVPKALEVLKSVLSGKTIKNFEINQLDNKGKIVHMEINVTPVRKDGKIIAVQGVMRDITERKKAEEKIKTALKEKEVMLKEIHHRVKNNMQIISSLLRLQFRETKSKKMQEMLRASQNRIRSMALIHERLYQSKDFTRIDFVYYIRSLTVYLYHSYRVNANIVRLKTDVRDVHLDINRAIPCGLIVNELVSNSLKHAFPGSREGEIFIKFYLNK